MFEIRLTKSLVLKLFGFREWKEELRQEKSTSALHQSLIDHQS